MPSLLRYLTGSRADQPSVPASGNLGTFRFVTAHRGKRYGDNPMPENLRDTLLCDEVKTGRINLETDVYAPTDSDELFIKHDGLLSGRDIGPIDPERRVYDATTNEMRRWKITDDNIDAHEADVNQKLRRNDYRADRASLRGTPIATLQEVVDELPENIHLYINYKTSRAESLNGDRPSKPNRPSNNDIERKVVQFIDKNDLHERSTVLVTSPTSLAKIKRLDANVKTGLLTDWLDRVPKRVRENPLLYRAVLYPYMLRAKLQANPKPAEKLLGRPIGIGADSIHPNYKQMNDTYAAVAERVGFDETTAWALGQTWDEEVDELKRIHDIAKRHDIPVGVISDIPDKALAITGDAS